MHPDRDKLIAGDITAYAVNQATGEKTNLGKIQKVDLPEIEGTGNPLPLFSNGVEISIDLEDAQFNTEALLRLTGTPEPKRIETLKEAADYAYGLSETRKEIADVEDVAADQIAKLEGQIQSIREWNEEVLKPLRSKVEYFTTLLADYHRRQYDSADGEKAKGRVTSIKLPYGITLASRHQQPKFEIADDAALLEYARSNDAVQITEKPMWADIKKQLKITDGGAVVDANGEALPFIQALQQDRKFEVK